MTHQDRLSIIITFVCGFVVGAYLYFAGFLPTYHLPDNVPTEDIYSGFVVVVDTYGGCEEKNQCLSFQLLSDRSFQAVLGADTNAKAFNGTLPKSLVRNLQTELNLEAIQSNTRTLLDSECHYVGEEASNFRFVITFEGRNYSLDTCRNEINYESGLWKSLREVYREIAAKAA